MELLNDKNICKQIFLQNINKNRNFFIKSYKKPKH